MNEHQPGDTPESPKLAGNEPDEFSENANPSFALGEQLRKWPVLAFGGVFLFAIVLGLSCYLIPKPSMAKSPMLDNPNMPSAGSASEVMAKAPDTVFVKESALSLPPQEDSLLPGNPSSGNGSMNPNAAMPPPTNAYAPPPIDYERQAQIQMEMQREQEADQRRAEQRDALKKAMEADSTVYSALPLKSGTNAQTASAIPANNEQTLDGIETPNTIQGRLSTLEGSNYLAHTRMPAISPYEIKAGTVIPSIMISGINSELPGQIVAQVGQNVYDSATGRYLLVPQGAKLVGTYDHAVNQGQKRVLIAWNRIIYPDSSSLNLETMAGQDQSGYAGFKDKTNNHTASIFKQALLLSAITAGVQLSQPRAQQGDYSYSSQQMIAGSLGMQLNQLGISTYQGRANMAPTITIRPGYRFNVMVSKDMVLPPWGEGNANAYQRTVLQTLSRR